MRILDRARPWTVLSALVLSSSLAGAQTPAQPSASPEKDEARQLYEAAIAAMDKDDFASACPQLENVVKLRPEGVGQRFTLAECYEKSGKLATAIRRYTEARDMAETARQPERVKKASAKLTELQSKVAMLTIEVPAALQGAAGLLVKLDGGAMDRAQWGALLPVDNGRHVLEVSATGLQSETVSIVVSGIGAHVSMQAPMLKPAATVTPTSTPSSEVQAPAASSPEVAAPRSKLPAFVLGGVGLASLILGGALVGVASGVSGDIDSKLPKDANGNSLCLRTPQSGEDPKCADLRSEAQSGSTKGNAGIGLMVAGGGLLAAAAVFLLIPSKKGPSDRKASQLVPVVSHQGGGIVWTGSF